MKKLSFILAIFLFTTTACEKYLDKSPDFGLVEEDVFSTYVSTRGYLDNCYAALLDIHSWESQSMQRTHISGLSDEAATIFGSPLNTILNTGDWLNKPGTGEVGWDGSDSGRDRGRVMDNAFFCIRVVNKVIANVDKVPGITAEQKNQLLGQAYFFRAWYYFQIIMRVGGMPIYDREYKADDNLDLPRLTYHESHAAVMKDLETALPLLPHKWSDAETGRVTKVAAMAFRSMAALYDASPLMQNNQNALPVNNGYDIERCKIAARYANEVLKYIATGQQGTNYRLMPKAEYKNIFYTNGKQVSDESLWYKMDGGATPGGRDFTRGIRVNYIPQHFAGGTGNDAASFTGPTQNMVDMFEVINNGKAYPITDPRSGYDPQNPFVNRDFRFSNNVIIPGQAWGRDANGNTLYMEMYTGGRDFVNATTNPQVLARTHTNYVCKKYWWPEANTFTSGGYTLNFMNTIYIRVSQVYLDYAEAMNEAYGPNADPEGFGMTALEAINTIRRRVDTPDVLPEFTTSKEVFRNRIYNERAVELMYENHRWHDLRRWMIAEEVFQKKIQGIRVTPPANHLTVRDKSTLKFTYQVFDIPTEVRVFQRKHYWYPVDNSEALSLSNFKQNPGW